MEEDSYFATEISENVTEIVDFYTETITMSYRNATPTNPSGGTGAIGWPPGRGGRRRPNLQVWALEIQILVACICSLIIFITVFGNLLVLVAYFTNRHLRTYVNYFICGLAMVDLIEGSFVQPLYAAYWILGYWPFSTQLCDAYRYINHVTGHTTYLFTLVICIDRYQALTRPFEHLKKRTHRHAVSLMSLAWLIPILSWIGPLLIWPKFGEVHPVLSLKIFCIPYYSLSKIFTLFVTIYVSWIPIVMICVMYIRIFIVMKKSVKMRDRENTLTLNNKLRKRSRSDSQFSIEAKEDGRKNSNVTDKGIVNNAYANNDETTKDNNAKKNTEDYINEISTIAVDITEKTIQTVPHKVSTALVTVPSVSFGIQNPPGRIRRQSSAKPSKDKIQRQNIRATKVLSMIVAVVLVSRVPWSVFSIYHVLCGPNCLPTNLYQVRKLLQENNFKQHTLLIVKT